MRLFIALELPDEAIAELEAARRRLCRCNSFPVKWVASHAYHLTLQFLGEVDKTNVPSIIATLGQIPYSGEQTSPTASALRLPQLKLAQVGAFPNMRRPQTIWVGVGGDIPALNAIQQAVATALEPLGFPQEKRSFHAHLTLGRVRKDAKSTQLSDLSDSLSSLQPPKALAWNSAPPVLFQSILKPSGPIYERLN